MTTIVSQDQFERSIKVVRERLPEMAPGLMKVPLSYYRDEEVYAREREIFMTMPRPLIGSTEIAKPNDYIVRQSMGLSILLTRDKDGKAHAFLNYCRHRGAEPAQGCGNAARISCPYHGWTYNTKGELVAMPLADRNAGLDYSQHGLVELPSEERHGLIWVILTPGLPIDIASHLGPIDKQFADQGMAGLDFHVALPFERLDCNWKCVGEGTIEAIHVPFVHRATFNVDPRTDDQRDDNRFSVFADIGMYERIGNHILWTQPLFGEAGLEAARADVAEGRPIEWQRWGNIWLLFPGIIIANDIYGYDVGVMEPGPTIDSAHIRYGWLAPQEGPAGYPTPSEMAERAALAIAEDKAVWEGCGRGLARGGHDYAVIGRNELGVQLFHEALAEATDYKHIEYL